MKVAHTRILDILLRQAKHHGTTPEQQAERFLRAGGADDARIAQFHAGDIPPAVVEAVLRVGLSYERTRIMAERAAKQGDVSVTAESVPFEDPCSEAYLRKWCGDDWELCWWGTSCAIVG